MKHENASVIDATEFASFMQDFVVGVKIVVAVSGGPDSMALLLLMREWARANNKEITALTVDHGLRENSANEVNQVAEWCEILSVPNHILYWQGDKPTSGIMEAARSARYDLLERWCHENNVKQLAIAHHEDDQVETILMRFAKGSGVDGLAGMKPSSMRGDVQLLRPLLSVPKKRLIATCNEAGQDFISDPSNENKNYARPRLRSILPLLEKEGFSAERMIDLASRMASAQDALEWLTDQAMSCTVDNAILDWIKLSEYPAEIQERVLRRIVQNVGGLDRPPKREQIRALILDLSRTNFTRTTLQNCLISKAQNKISFSAEKPFKSA